jgi:hypothetical protein
VGRSPRNGTNALESNALSRVDPEPPANEQPVFCLGIFRHTGTSRGRGVYASRTIERGEIVEVCPVVLLPGPFMQLPLEVRRIVFPWGELAGEDSIYAISLGYGGIYNHANPANLYYAALVRSGCLQFTAARRIAVGEEMTINFNSLSGDIASDADTWFESLGIKPA